MPLTVIYFLYFRVRFRITSRIYLSCLSKLLQFRIASLCLSWPWHFLSRGQASYFVEGPSVCCLMVRFRLWIWGWNNTEVMCPSPCVVWSTWWRGFLHCKDIIFPLLSVSHVWRDTLRYVNTPALTWFTLYQHFLPKSVITGMMGKRCFSKSIMSCTFPR